MSNLTPEVRVNKNGVPVTKHVNATGKDASSGRKSLPVPALSDAPRRKRMFAGTVRELEELGIPLTNSLPRTHAIKQLVKNDQQMLERVVESIAKADSATREVWSHGIGRLGGYMSFHNSVGYERMLANNELTARLISAIGPEVFHTPRLFQTENLAIDIEETTGIRPGSERYNEVQAGIIYCAITDPLQVSRANTDLSYLDTHRDDVMTIAHNMDRVVAMLPELCKRRDASRHTINSLDGGDAPSLIAGIL
jgi:hypothetical protein